MAKNERGQSGLVPETYLEIVADCLPGAEEGDAGKFSARSDFTVLGCGRLLADFTAEADGELSVEAGGIVTLLRPAGGLPEGWLYGQRNGQEGLVPESYVEVRTFAQTRVTDACPPYPPPIRCGQPIGFGSTGVEDSIGGVDVDGTQSYVDVYDQGGSTGEGPMGEDSYGTRMMTASAGGGTMCVLADFVAEDEKEVTVMRGQVIHEVVNQGDGWALASLTQGAEHAGLVPWEYLAAPHGSMLADFVPEDAGEVPASAGQQVWQVDATPGGAVGWAQVVLDDGRSGLVPENYIRWRDPVSQPMGSNLGSDDFSAADVYGDDSPSLDAGIMNGIGDDATLNDGSGDSLSPTAEGAESVSAWLAYTTVLVSNSDKSAALDAVALADFTAEAPVEMSITEGERLALLHGVEPPRGWKIALRLTGDGGGTTKGLVPETYVRLLPFYAKITSPYSDETGLSLSVCCERLTCTFSSPSCSILTHPHLIG